MFEYRVVKIVNSEHVPCLGDFYKWRGQTLCFSQGWMPEPIDTVTVGCICKNSLNSPSKSCIKHYETEPVTFIHT